MEHVFLKRAWAEINLDNLVHNLNQIREIVGEKPKIMAVVKADAYGHGDVMVVRQLAQNGADWFAVSNLTEALRIREAGVFAPILVLGPTPAGFAEVLAKQNISQTVHSLQYAKELSRIAQTNGLTVKCHIKLETGMNRLGFLARTSQELEELLLVYSLPSLEFEGTFTHLSSSDQVTEAAVCYSESQFKKFEEICAVLKQKGVNLGLRHCCNSAGLVSFKHMHLDMVRPGILLYGVPERQWRGNRPWKPVMSFKSVITSIKDLPVGECISYGRTFKTPRATRVGVVSVGYADGFRRHFSNLAKVMVGGGLAPVIGAICMDQMMIDLTDCKNAKVGDEVLIFGNDKICNVNTLAEQVEATNCDEIMCSVSRRVPRLYFKDGVECELIDYCDEI